MGSLLAVTGLLTGFLAVPAAASPSVIVSSVPMARADVIEPMSHGYCNNVRTISLAGSTYARLPSIGTGGSTHCVMNVGANSNGVVALQQAMVRCYNGPAPRPSINIAIDGVYGSQQTAPAVRRVQTYHGIGVDGVYGPQTRSAMWWQEFISGIWTGYCVRGFI